MSDAAVPQRVITELKVSGHLMTLDNGVFCLFYAPGSTPPSSATGLPGVRLSLPPELPAQGARQATAPGALSISTFREDGWLGGQDSAALIRVTRGPAQVLVTVYQDTDGLHEAPRLQVMRLSGGPDAVPAQAEAAPQTAPHSAAGRDAAGAERPRNGPGPVAQGEAGQAMPGIGSRGPAEAARAGGVVPAPAPASGVTPAEAEVAAHVQGRGDVLTRLDEWMGERGSQRWIEGFAIAPRQPVTRDDIEYQAVLGRGWLSPWSDGGHYCGSRGMALPILGLRVRLRGAAAERFDCRVSATFVDGTAIGPTDTGEACEAESLAPLEAFHIEIAPKPALAAIASAALAAAPAAAVLAGPDPAAAPDPAAPPVLAAPPVPAVLRAPATAPAQEPAPARAVRKPARATFKPAPPPRGKPAPVGRGKR